MKKTIAPILIIAILAFAFYLWIRSRRPKVVVDSIDWQNKTADITFSANGDTWQIKQSLNGEINKYIAKGKLTFTVDTFSQDGMQLAILDGDKLLTGTFIDFKNKAQTPLPAYNGLKGL